LQHIPVSDDASIEVKLIEPKYKEDTDSLIINKQGLIERKITVKSNEEISEKLKFTVEYSKDIRVQGI
jgi:hypothetical protein